jgi:hypothetical protein
MKKPPEREGAGGLSSNEGGVVPPIRLLLADADVVTDDASGTADGSTDDGVAAGRVCSDSPDGRAAQTTFEVGIAGRE